MPQRKVGAIPTLSILLPALSALFDIVLMRSAEVSDVLTLKSPVRRR